jgi:hypothetical protein
MLVQKRRCDNVRSAYPQLVSIAKLTCEKPLMSLRHTGATLLARRFDRGIIDNYLAHSPDNSGHPLHPAVGDAIPPGIRVVAS